MSTGRGIPTIPTKYTSKTRGTNHAVKKYTGGRVRTFADVFLTRPPDRHTGARRGVPLLGRLLRPGHWLSLTGAPVRWQGGRKARMKETLVQPYRSVVDALGR